jgi:hypothetical protein
MNTLDSRLTAPNELFEAGTTFLYNEGVCDPGRIREDSGANCIAIALLAAENALLAGYLPENVGIKNTLTRFSGLSFHSDALLIAPSRNPKLSSNELWVFDTNFTTLEREKLNVNPSVLQASTLGVSARRFLEQESAAPVYSNLQGSEEIIEDPAPFRTIRSKHPGTLQGTKTQYHFVQIAQGRAGLTACYEALRLPVPLVLS